MARAAEENAAKRQKMQHGWQQKQSGLLWADGEEEEDPELLARLAAETAWAAGFNAEGVTDSEEGLLPPGADERTYVKVGELGEGCKQGQLLVGMLKE